MTAAVIRLALACLCAGAGMLMALYHLSKMDTQGCYAWFVGSAFVAALIAPNAEDTGALIRGLTAKGE